MTIAQNGLMPKDVRDEQALKNSGLTAEQAVQEIDSLIWDGIRIRDTSGGPKPTD